MKKLVATVIVLLMSLTAEALPVGNPAEASLFLHGAWWENACCDPCDPCFSWCDAWSLRLGYYGDFVFNRHMKTEGSIRGEIDKTELFTNAGYLAFNICNRVDIFGTLGATNLHIKTDARAWRIPTSLESELFFDLTFSWSAGARASIWQCDNFAVGLEGQYFQTKPDFSSFLEYENGQIIRFNTSNRVRYAEWQVGLGLAYRFATYCPTIAMVPYAAVKWAGSRLNLNNFTFIQTIGGISRTLVFPRLESKKLWGYAIGISLTLCDIIGVNIEGRWGDEKACAVNGNFRF